EQPAMRAFLEPLHGQPIHALSRRDHILGWSGKIEGMRESAAGNKKSFSAEPNSAEKGTRHCRNRLVNGFGLSAPELPLTPIRERSHFLSYSESGFDTHGEDPGLWACNRTAAVQNFPP